MNRTTAVAVMVGALIGGSVPLALVNMHQQTQEQNQSNLAEEHRQDSYYLCTRGISYIEKDDVRTYFNDLTGDWITDKKSIERIERTLQRCDDLYGKGK
jgi:hypothetical protein